MMKLILFVVPVILVIVGCTPGCAKSSAIIDFQFLLDPKETQATLEKLTKVSEVVKEKRLLWEDELRNLNFEGAASTTNDQFQDSILQSLKSTDYKDVLERYGKYRMSKEKEAQLKQKVVLGTSFLKTMDKLQDLLSKGHESPTEPGFIQFSQLRSLIKTLRGLSFDLFTPTEAAEDFGEICFDILTIRRPTVDLKTDYKEFCF